MKTKWQLHVDKWKGGCGSPLCERANKVCLMRGSVPCHVLFVGEGPGDSENVIGVPFVGPAGAHLQRYVIRRAIPHRHIIDGATKQDRWVPTSITYALTNIVGCMPTDESGLKSGAPEEGDVARCAPRLLEAIDLCRPKLIVCVGKEAATFLDQTYKFSVWNYDPKRGRHEGCKIPRVEITHPAAILRQNIAAQGLMFQRAALAVEAAIAEYVSHDCRPNVYDGDGADPCPF